MTRVITMPKLGIDESRNASASGTPRPAASAGIAKAIPLTNRKELAVTNSEMVMIDQRADVPDWTPNWALVSVMASSKRAGSQGVRSRRVSIVTAPGRLGQLDSAGPEPVLQLGLLHGVCSKDHEPDGDVVAECRHCRAGVKQLVVAECRRPGVRPAQSVEPRTEAVKNAANSQEHDCGHPGLV